MRFNTKISCKDLSNYTIYFLILGGREVVLYGERKVFLTNPKDENFTAWGLNENVSFNNIDFIYYNLPIFKENGKILDAIIWWDLLAKDEKENLKNIYASNLVESEGTFSDISIKYIYRELLLDQFKKGIIQLPEYEKYLNWWKVLPRKSIDKILYENLKAKHYFNYDFEDVKFLYSLSFPELDNNTMSILLWWYELDNHKKINLIHKYINPHFHITAPNIDQIKMLYEKE